jgi:hypothetical protein
MKRTAVAFSLLAAVGGCVSTESGAGPGPVLGPNTVVQGPNTVPGAIGPGGVPVPARAAASAGGLPSGEEAAKAFIATHMPPELVQQVAYDKGEAGPAVGMPPPGVPLAPGMAPGGPGAGVVPAGGYPNAAVAALGALTGAYAGQFAAARTSVRFVEPKGMKVSWYIQTPDGRRTWSDKPLEAPATYNFTQAAIYRLKLSDLPDQPGVDLYPSLEVVPANQRALTFLAHSSVPVSFTPDDFRMVACGNYVVKVIYLPDPQYQDIAVGGGLCELISTQLEPGVDPIAEACKRGSILLIVRLGNIDLELRHSPGMDAPPPRQAAPPGAGMPHGAMGMLPSAPGMAAGNLPPPPGIIMTPNGPMMAPSPPPTGTPPTRPTNLPGLPGGQGTGNPSLPPLPPQTNPLTPAQMATQPGR